MHFFKVQKSFINDNNHKSYENKHPTGIIALKFNNIKIYEKIHQKYFFIGVTKGAHSGNSFKKSGQKHFFPKNRK